MSRFLAAAPLDAPDAIARLQMNVKKRLGVEPARREDARKETNASAGGDADMPDDDIYQNFNDDVPQRSPIYSKID